MARALPYLEAACATLFLSCTVMGQTAYPDHVIQDETWTDGVHHVAVTQKILSPGDVHEPMTITGTADAEYVSGTSIRLAPGFHAGAFNGNGRLRAYIDPGLGPDGDVVLIAPAPVTAIAGHVLHVPKWEKLEVGLRLPQEYQAAIGRFFAHYYADPNDPYEATPGNVDPAHDLNPYADDSLQLVLTLTRPDGSQTLKWGFFMRESKWNGSSNAALLVEDPANTLHPYNIRFRMAPDMEGGWQFTLSVAAPHTVDLAGAPLTPLQFTGYAFTCDPPLPDNHGPMRVNEANRRTLQFEDGTPYFGLGTNFSLVAGHGNGWWDMDNYRLTRQSFTEATDAMAALHSVGGNFVRIFLGNRTLSPEYVNLGLYDRYHESLACVAGGTPTSRGNYQDNCWAFDQLVDHARTTGIYLQACIKPYPPISAYETWGWRNDAYLHSFVLPRDPMTNLFDLKRYFYSGGDTANTTSGAFYYWKRRYKYIMNRWGYSVNIPIIEPFNEIDQMLTYQDVTATDLCTENNIHWAKDDDLPGLISQWVSDIAQFVRGGVDLNEPAGSPLGYGNKLFLMSYARSEPTMPGANDFYLPFLNPDVDLIDAHRGMGESPQELSRSFDHSQQFWNTYTNIANGHKRPFHQGESNYYQYKDVYGQNNQNDTVSVDGAQYFDNYDVSFHNEIWASTFFGNFAAATTWQKERVFWWDPQVPPKDRPHGTEPGNHFQPFGLFSNVLGDTNLLDLGAPYPVVNKPIYHNFKPLADFLSNPNLQGYNFFNGDFRPHKAYDDANKLECFYLTNQDSTMAIGWVHNLNAYWENHYYLQRAVQNYLGCTPPAAQSISLPGFQPGLDFHVTWFPTRMNDTIRPANATDQSGTGTVLLDMSTAPLGGIAYNYLDTLHADYAFIVALEPVHRNIQIATEDPTVPYNEDFGMFPNPASNSVTLALPSDGVAKDITLYDLTGHRVFSTAGVEAALLTIPTGNLARGAYCLRVSDPLNSKVKTLILR